MPQQQALSPERYIKEKARLLPIVECWITDGWDKCGLGTAIVARQHKNGNYTLGIYMFDTFCCGLTDSLYHFNVPEYEYREMLEEGCATLEMNPISYEELHNLIYGAVAFAEEAGLGPHSSFKLTQYILEEDTDEIPLIEYEFGKDGKHFLVATSRFQVNTLLPVMKKNLGDDFSYVLKKKMKRRKMNMMNMKNTMKTPWIVMLSTLCWKHLAGCKQWWKNSNGYLSLLILMPILLIPQYWRFRMHN